MSDDDEVSPLEWAEVLYGDEPDPDQVDGWIGDPSTHEGIDGFEHACWAWSMGQAAEARSLQYAQEINRLIRKLEARKAEVCGPWDRRAQWWFGRVAGWHRAQNADPDSPIGKTVKFPTGGASKLSGAQPFVAGTVRHDELIAFLEGRKGPDGKSLSLAEKVYPDRATWDSRFRISELRKLFNLKRGSEPGDWAQLVDPATGEVVPGISLKEAEDNWTRGS